MAGDALNIFSYLVLTISRDGLYSPSSCPTERGDRDRHVRGVGCGGRWRCGVTRFGGDVCLRAGRICASTATGKETFGLGMERLRDSVTDDQIETRSAQSLEAPFPSPWDFNSVIGSFAEAKCKQPKKHRRRNAGQSLVLPKVLMHYPMRKTAFASGPRVHLAPGVPHALFSKRVEGMLIARTRKRRENASVCLHVTEAGTATPLDLGKHSCLLLRRTDLKTPTRQAHGQTRIT